MSFRPFRSTCVLVCIAALIGACDSPRPGREGGPMLLVTIDTLSASRVGCYGAVSARTPMLDRLARQGLQVRDAISPAPLTLPSHSTILTGLDPWAHGVRENGMFRVDEAVTTLAERLPAELPKAAFVGAFPLASRFGLAQGFDEYEDATRADAEDDSRPPERRADRVFSSALAWIAQRPADASAFVWTHVFDPHYPYVAPAPWPAVLTRGGGDDYDAEVAFTDHELARYLRALDAADADRGATVLVVADHGESLGEHGELTHSLFVYDATQRVPAILAGPGIPARLEPRQRALVDVTPTILDRFDVPPANDLPGASLLERSAPEAAYVETKSPELMRGWSPLHGLRTEEWKYIRAPRSELYDLRADPGETVNRFDANPDVAARFERELSGRLAQSRSPGDDPSLDDETAARLRALGYVATIEPGTKADLRQDPKDGAEMVATLFRGEEAFQRRNFVVARRYLERAIELDPGSKEAHSFLAGTMVELSRWSAAVEHAERALELPPHWNEAPLHTTAAEALLALGRPGDAIPHLRRAMELAPRDEKAARLLARAEERAR